MILAAHVIISAYGFWLPNDPRGSWSDFVRAWELLKFGDATKIDERRSVAGRLHDSALRAAAKKELMYPPVIFNGRQAAAIAYGFADVVRIRAAKYSPVRSCRTTRIWSSLDTVTTSSRLLIC